MSSSPPAMFHSPPPAKRIKREFNEMEENSSERGDYEKETQKTLEEIDACQNHIDALNEKASEDILKVEQKYNKLRKPFFEKRNEIIQSIPNFWITAFVNHPQITTVLDEDEEDCLHYLRKLEVEEFEDIKFGYKINFHFVPNPYLENSVLTKEFHLGAPEPCSKSTPIRWKQGQNIVKLIREKQNQKQAKKRTSETKAFFTWYEDNCDPSHDEIAEVIKDDLWPNPLQYYLSPDVEVDVNGMEDDGDDEEGSDDEGDDSVVIVEEIEDDEDEDVIVEVESSGEAEAEKSQEESLSKDSQEAVELSPKIEVESADELELEAESQSQTLDTEPQLHPKPEPIE